MAASPRERRLPMSPIARQVASSLETALDVHITTRRARDKQIDWNLGHCGEAIAYHLETKYRQAGWTYSRAYEVDDVWTLALSRSRLVLPEGIAPDDN
jgi:hypothetical protein